MHAAAKGYLQAVRREFFALVPEFMLLRAICKGQCVWLSVGGKTAHFMFLEILQAPTVAATDESMQALVVSKETIPGAEDINRYRRDAGYAELQIIVVDLIADTQAVQGGKVSSTALREQEAARLRGQMSV